MGAKHKPTSFLYILFLKQCTHFRVVSVQIVDRKIFNNVLHREIPISQLDEKQAIESTRIRVVWLNLSGIVQVCRSVDDQYVPKSIVVGFWRLSQGIEEFDRTCLREMKHHPVTSFSVARICVDDVRSRSFYDIRG